MQKKKEGRRKVCGNKRKVVGSYAETKGGRRKLEAMRKQKEGRRKLCCRERKRGVLTG